jgi:hypothetical protein
LPRTENFALVVLSQDVERSNDCGVALTNLNWQWSFETAVNEVKVFRRKLSGSFDSFAIDFDADNLNLAIHFAQALQKFNRGDWAGAETEVDHDGVFVSNDFKSCDKSINATKSIRVCCAPSNYSAGFLGCHSSNLMPGRNRTRVTSRSQTLRAKLKT